MMTPMFGDPGFFIRCAALAATLTIISFVTGHGSVTATALASMAIAGEGLRKWRSERGLWMLACFFLVIFSALYIFMIMGDVLNGVMNGDLLFVIDFTAAACIQLTTFWFLITVTRDNFVLSRRQRSLS